jgi:Ca-activated chloride channel family protein
MDTADRKTLVRETSRWPLALRSLLVFVAVICFAPGVFAQLKVAGARMVARTDQGQEWDLPLVEESVRVEIDQQHATSVLRRVYQNTSSQRVEGVFSFRGGDEVNVAGFAYWNGEQKIVGEVMETWAARRVYQSTIARRRDPGILEKTGEGSFSFKIFPISPGERKRVELTIDRWIPRRDRVLEYRIPLAHGGAEVDVSIRDDRRIRRVTSPTHELEVTGLGTSEARVRVQGRRAGELVLRWELEDSAWRLSAHAHRDGKELGYAVISLAAPPLAADPGQDLTIVLDASSTMAGEPLQAARVAAGRIVDRLHGVDRFNLVVIGAETRSLFASPRWATRAARADAITWLLGVDARGSGDLGSALSHALSLQETTPRHKTILLLTDGRNGARSALRVASEDRSQARIFTVGFGNAVDRPSLSRLAAIKRGRFTLVDSDEVLDGRVEQLSHQIAAPGLTHLSLEAQGGTLGAVYPQALPDVFPGQEVRVLARVEAAGPVRITLHADAQGAGPVSLTTTLDLRREQRRPWIGKLWARERVAFLLEEIALAGERDSLKKETIELALAYNIVTPYTSFLAIPASEVLTPDAAATLADARRLKASIMANRPDAQALFDAAKGSSSDVDQSNERAVADSPPTEMRASAPEPASESSRVRFGGCAGCVVVGGARSSTPAIVLVAATVLALRLRRRRSSVLMYGS